MGLVNIKVFVFTPLGKIWSLDEQTKMRFSFLAMRPPYALKLAIFVYNFYYILAITNSKNYT